MIETEGDFKTVIALQELYAERDRQKEKWGEQEHSFDRWLSIATEELGEAAKVLVDYGALRTVDELENFKKEIVQFSAVGVQIIEMINKNIETRKVNHPNCTHVPQDD